MIVCTQSTRNCEVEAKSTYSGVKTPSLEIKLTFYGSKLISA
ncbi:hypothetical protein PL9631_1070085 [Planktothrix paucivesiculata PCC 9631]|uniref:Uncharacterized protein n=1 Tax=Planktothrix paucivesiculata PCC 9631 TaxID=671071 RepID=A0A7Z9DW56_9CYAN|nr:hypothetical protein PL9631_1070085 [Planktothrix paucivesiculata PCC 9631]